MKPGYGETIQPSHSAAAALVTIQSANTCVQWDYIVCV